MHRRPNPEDWHRCRPYDLDYTDAVNGHIQCCMCGWGWKLEGKGWKRVNLSELSAV